MLVSEITSTKTVAIPDLIFFVDLHTQLSPVLVNRTVVDTTASCIIYHSTTPLVSIGERKAHFYVMAQWPSFRHETRALVRVFHQHCLLKALVYNELVSHKVVVNLEIVSHPQLPCNGASNPYSECSHPSQQRFVRLVPRRIDAILASYENRRLPVTSIRKYWSIELLSTYH